MSRWLDPAPAVVLLGIAVVGTFALTPLDVPTPPERDGPSAADTERSGEPSFTVDCPSAELEDPGVHYPTIFVRYTGGTGRIDGSGEIERLYATAEGAEIDEERTYFDLPAEPGASVIVFASDPPEAVVVVAEHDDGTETVFERTEPCERS
jgi:hypothetical protein